MTSSDPPNPESHILQNEVSSDDQPRAIDLLQKIKSGQTSPRSISIGDRRLIVEMLMIDGATIPEIAQILGVSEQTIKRDKRGIRASNAIERDPKLIGQMVGRLVTEADAAMQRIRRAIRDPRAMPAAKVDVEHRCYQIFSDVFRHLQRIGFVPTAPQEIRGDLTHRIADPPGFDEIQQELTRIEHIGHHMITNDPQFSATINKVRDRVTRLALGEQLEHFSDAVNKDVETGNTHKDEPK